VSKRKTPILILKTRTLECFARNRSTIITNVDSKQHKRLHMKERKRGAGKGRGNVTHEAQM